MSIGTKSTLTTPETLSAEQIDHFRRRGFVKVENVLTPEEVEQFRAASLRISREEKSRPDEAVFDQHVNVWTRHEDIRPLTLHPNLGGIAQVLADATLRLWHDHILIKRPHNTKRTEFHQDQPFWPFSNDIPALSCWVALCDVPLERGCMTFLPETHRRTDLIPQNLHDAESLFTLVPDLRYHERVTLPLRAGDCTFHYGCCAHMANANETDEPRVAVAIIYMDADARYNGKKHVVTDPLGLSEGDALDQPQFPTVEAMAAGAAAPPPENEGR